MDEYTFLMLSFTAALLVLGFTLLVYSLRKEYGNDPDRIED